MSKLKVSLQRISPPASAAIARLALLSRRLGTDPLLSQGSGGNTGFKHAPNRLLIKTSGTPLKHVTQRQGWADTDLAALREGFTFLWTLRAERDQQEEYRRLISSATLTPNRRVSIETGLHVLLPDRWTAHAHSLAGQLLGLMPAAESRSLIGAIFGNGMDLRVIAPASPGYDLAQAIHAELKEHSPRARPETKTPSLWILQNHGIAWAGKSEKDILAASNVFEKFLRDRFSLTDFPAPVPTPLNRARARDDRPWYRLRFDAWPRVRWGKIGLFPDFVGHFTTGKDGNLDWVNDREIHFAAASSQERQSHAEVFFAHALLSTIAYLHGWHRPLPPPCIRRIRTYLLEGSKSSPNNSKGY